MDVISCKIKMRMHFYGWYPRETEVKCMLRIEIASEIRKERKKQDIERLLKSIPLWLVFHEVIVVNDIIVLWLEQHEYENYNLCVSVNVNRAQNHWVVHYSHANLLSCNDSNGIKPKSNRVESNWMESKWTGLIHKVTLHPKFMRLKRCSAMHTHTIWHFGNARQLGWLWWFRCGKWIIANSISLDRNILIMRRLPMAMAMAMQHTLQNWK